jgi:PAS domain S-box-containing protein
MIENIDNVRLRKRISDLEKSVAQLREENESLKVDIEDNNRSLERYKLIADFAHDWEIWFNPDGGFEYISPAFQSITGYTPDELLSQPSLINLIIYPSDLEKYLEFVDNAINLLNIRQSLSFRILTRTKQVRWCEIKSRAVYNKRGKYLGQRASVNDVTKLMQALGEIKNLSDGKEFDLRARQKYLRDIESKDRELFSYLMTISHISETLQYIKNNLKRIGNTRDSSDQEVINKMIEHIDSPLFSAETWDNFRLHFEKLHPGFFERLQTRFPSLTARDRKLCAYLRLELATKEIAVLMNITPESTEISRVRLRKKLKLERKTSLTEFISRV